MFNGIDESFRSKPRYMSPETIKKTLDKIGAHISEHNLSKFSITLHGGEPLLWPRKYFDQLFDHITHLQNNDLIELNIQTNAFQRFDDEILSLLAAHRVSIGVSVDGPPHINDLSRVDHKGRGTYHKVLENVEELTASKYKNLLSGFLCVIDPYSDIAEYFNWIKSLPLPRVDALLPMEYNYDGPPWGEQNQATYANLPKYGVWLYKLFIRWLQEDDPDIHIRILFETLKVYFGSKIHTDNIVNDSIPMFVVNTDGAFEYPDYLRYTGPNGCTTAYNVFEHSINDLVKDPVYNELLNLSLSVPSECTYCPVVHLCGGGFLPGRMSGHSTNLNRRSVYCHDHYHFFLGVIRYIEAQQASHSRAQANSVSTSVYKGTPDYLLTAQAHFTTLNP